MRKALPVGAMAAVAVVALSTTACASGQHDGGREAARLAADIEDLSRRQQI